jgi:hypothetical protein
MGGASVPLIFSARFCRFKRRIALRRQKLASQNQHIG